MPFPTLHLVPLGIFAAIGLGLLATPTASPPSLDETTEIAIAEMRLYGDREEIGRQFQEVLAREPEHGRANFGIGMAAFQAKRFDEAQKYLTKALEKDPKNAEIKLALAASYQKAKRLDDALRLYEELKRDDPQNGRVLNNLAELEISRKNYAAARDHMAAYIATLPKKSRSRQKAMLRLARLDAVVGKRPKPGASASPAPKK